jgi:hypothetical protein
MSTDRRQRTIRMALELLAIEALGGMIGAIADSKATALYAELLSRLGALAVGTENDPPMTAAELQKRVRTDSIRAAIAAAVERQKSER